MREVSGAGINRQELRIIYDIRSRIYTICGVQVMLDKDLAELYDVSTKALNQAVKRNIQRFPEDFRFQITDEEKNELVTNCDRFKRLKHSSTLPYAFTEQGVAMLSVVLHSEIAVKINIRKNFHHYTPCGVQVYRDRSVFTTTIPFIPLEKVRHCLTNCRASTKTWRSWDVVGDDFQVIRSDIEVLRSQFVISKCGRKLGSQFVALNIDESLSRQTAASIGGGL